MFLTKKMDSQYTRGYRLLQSEDFEKDVEAKKPSPPIFANNTSR